MHGAGSAKREARGERTNPALPAVLAGAQKAEKATAILLEQHPEFAALYRHHLNAPMSDVLDFRSHLAAAKALADLYLQKSTLEGNYGPNGTDPTIIRAMDAILAAMKATERALAIDAKLGPMTHLELAWMRHAYAATLAEFVPCDQLEAARVFCLQKLEEARSMGLERAGA